MATSKIPYSGTTVDAATQGHDFSLIADYPFGVTVEQISTTASPSGNAGTSVVFKVAGNRAIQLFIDRYGTTLYFRTTSNSGGYAWNDWRSVAGTAVT